MIGKLQEREEGKWGQKDLLSSVWHGQSLKHLCGSGRSNSWLMAWNDMSSTSLPIVPTRFNRLTSSWCLKKPGHEYKEVPEKTHRRISSSNPVCTIFYDLVPIEEYNNRKKNVVLYHQILSQSPEICGSGTAWTKAGSFIFASSSWSFFFHKSAQSSFECLYTLRIYNILWQGLAQITSVRRKFFFFVPSLALAHFS